MPPQDPHYSPNAGSLHGRASERDLSKSQASFHSTVAEAGISHTLMPKPCDDTVYILDRASSREIDRAAEIEFGMPTLLLMENAAVWLSAYAAAIVPDDDSPSALIVAGRGNNGGDGLAMARHLACRGWSVAIVLSGAPSEYSGDAAINVTMCQRLELPITSAAECGPHEAIVRARTNLRRVSLVVDALLGTGATGPLRSDAAAMIREINALGDEGICVLAVDIPSGLCADTGAPLPFCELTGSGVGRAGGASPVERGNRAAGDGPAGVEVAVRADVTVSLVGMKPGFLTFAAQQYVGDVLIADIGVPRALLARLGRPLAKPDRPGGDYGLRASTRRTERT